MKKLFIYLTLLMIVINCYSQTRQNRTKLTFINQSETIDKAIGWANNLTIGEWIDFENVISNDKDYKTKYKSLQGGYMMSRESQNFISMQFKTINMNSKTYYVLLVEKWKGKYKYPAIYEDWYEWKETFGYIYEKDEYNKILEINNVGEISEIKTKRVISLGSSYEKYDEIKFLDLIQTNLKSEISKYSPEYKFPIMLANAEDQKVIRFYVPESFSKYSKNSKYDFDKEYFEIAPSEFIKLKIIE